MLLLALARGGPASAAACFRLLGWAACPRPFCLLPSLPCSSRLFLPSAGPPLAVDLSACSSAFVVFARPSASQPEAHTRHETREALAVSRAAWASPRPLAASPLLVSLRQPPLGASRMSFQSRVSADLSLLARRCSPSSSCPSLAGCFFLCHCHSAFLLHWACRFLLLVLSISSRAPVFRTHWLLAAGSCPPVPAGAHACQAPRLHSELPGDSAALPVPSSRSHVSTGTGRGGPVQLKSTMS